MDENFQSFPSRPLTFTWRESINFLKSNHLWKKESAS